MSEVTADAPTLAMRVPSSLDWTRVLIAEFYPVVNVIADRLNQRPSFRSIAERRPGDLGKAIGLAVPAAEKVNERLGRKLLKRMLLGVGSYLVLLPAVSDHKICRDGKSARRRVDNVAGIAETVAIAVGRDGRIELKAVRRYQIGNTRRMHAQHQDHGRRLRAAVGNLVAGLNLHRDYCDQLQF